MSEAHAEVAHLMPASVGAAIRERRERAGWNQRELGARVGVRREQVNRWENGRPISPDSWSAIADALGVLVDPTAPHGFRLREFGEAGGAPAPAAGTTVNLVILVTSPADAATVLGRAQGRTLVTSSATAADVLRHLGITPTG